MKISYHFPASVIGHTYENVDQVMNDIINLSNLDIIGKKIGSTVRLSASI